MSEELLQRLAQVTEERAILRDALMRLMQVTTTAELVQAKGIIEHLLIGPEAERQNVLNAIDVLIKTATP